MGAEINVHKFCATRPAPHSRNTESATSVAIMALRQRFPSPEIVRALRDGPGVQRLSFTAGRIAKTSAEITESDNVNAMARQSTCADSSSGLRSGNSATSRRAIAPDNTRPAAPPHTASTSPPEETGESGGAGSRPRLRESQLRVLAAANAPAEPARYWRTQSAAIRRRLPAEPIAANAASPRFRPA